MAKEKKKKTTPIIVEKPEINIDFGLVHSSHFEPTWHRPVPLFDESTTSYYPSGQRIIEEKGQEYNYDNFVANFGNRITYGDLQSVENLDRWINRIFRLSDTRKYSIYNTLHKVFLTLLTTGFAILVLSLPLYYLIQNGMEDLSINLLWAFLSYAIPVIILSFIGSVWLNELKINIKISKEADRLNQDEL